MLRKNKENKFKIIIIAGPTASGKSSLALHLAKKYNSIIINADSQQIYKELPILSSQPNKKDYKKISHKLFNFLDFYKHFSVDQWFKLVKKEIINKTALGRMGNPEDIAAAAYLLYKSTYMTGQVLKVDGGRFPF